jgi:hypothetical protein
MRKCESIIRQAALSGRNVTVQNTSISHCAGEYTVYLHGNAIAHGRTGHLPASFRLAGWNSVTTRSRLHALGVGVTSRDWTPYYNGKAIDARAWHPVDGDKSDAKFRAFMNR